MKKDIHPNDYRPVVFEDLNNGFRILTRSTVKTPDVTKWEDGKEYPLVKVHISSASHPFFTGQEKLVDIEGRVDRFKSRQDAGAKAKEAKIAASKVKKAKKTVNKDADIIEIAEIQPPEVETKKEVEPKQLKKTVKKEVKVVKKPIAEPTKEEHLDKTKSEE